MTVDYARYISGRRAMENSILLDIASRTFLHSLDPKETFAAANISTSDLRWEPGALAAHAEICAGERGNRHSYREHFLASVFCHFGASIILVG